MCCPAKTSILLYCRDVSVKKGGRLKMFGLCDLVLPYNPAVTFLGIYPVELKSCVHTEICTRMLIAVLSWLSKHGNNHQALQ